MAGVIRDLRESSRSGNASAYKAAGALTATYSRAAC